MTTNKQSDSGLKADELAKIFHDNYERLAPLYGYKTRDDSAVPWDEVPVNNRNLMIATAKAVMDETATRTPDTEMAEAIREAVEAMAPYRQRKKMTRRSDCTRLNEVYSKLTNLLNRSN